MKFLSAFSMCIMLIMNPHNALAVDDEEAATYKAELTRQVIVKDNQINLSVLTKIVNDDLALTIIYSTITVQDAISLYNDFVYLKEKTNIRNWHLYINSAGGSAFDGLAIADQFLKFRKEGFTMTAYASGIVASATIPILAVCSQRVAAKDTIFLVHNLKIVPDTTAGSTSNDIESQNALMSMMARCYVNLVASHSSLTAEKWQKLEDKQTWFTAKDALKWGLIDKIE